MGCVRVNTNGTSSASGNARVLSHTQAVAPFPVQFRESDKHEPLDISIKELALKRQFEQLLPRAPVETKGYKSLINLPDQ
jgi:hypothetical protein